MRVWKNNTPGKAFPAWGRWRAEDTAFLDTTTFPRGKSKRRRLRRQKRKPTPPRCARQPLPREGARVVTPSFLWKEVPRRGRRLDGKSGMKESEGDRLKCVVYESTLSTADAVPLPQWGRLRYEDTAFLASSKRIQDTWRKRITTDKAFPAWGRWRAKRAG